jgi:hypothetical protein
VKYVIDYQYMPEGAARPIDDGEIVGIEATDKGGLVILPNVGDFVRLDREGGSQFRGRVVTRYFSHDYAGGDWICVVNIVVAEVPGQDWGNLLNQ